VLAVLIAPDVATAKFDPKISIPPSKLESPVTVIVSFICVDPPTVSVLSTSTNPPT